jgi:hypothetical protein
VDILGVVEEEEYGVVEEDAVGEEEVSVGGNHGLLPSLELMLPPQPHMLISKEC